MRLPSRDRDDGQTDDLTTGRASTAPTQESAPPAFYHDAILRNAGVYVAPYVDNNGEWDPVEKPYIDDSAVRRGTPSLDFLPRSSSSPVLSLWWVCLLPGGWALAH